MRRRLGPSNTWGWGSWRSKLHNSADPSPSHPGCAPTSSVHLPIKWEDVEVVNLENSIRIFAKKRSFCAKNDFLERRCARIFCGRGWFSDPVFKHIPEGQHILKAQQVTTQKSLAARPRPHRSLRRPSPKQSAPWESSGKASRWV